MSSLFGPIRQLGYVVQDINAAMVHWTQTMRIGPFYYHERTPILSTSYRGSVSDVQASTALTYSGDMQILLIQQHNDASSSFQDFLNAGGQGLHHVGFYSTSYERDLRRAAEAGLEVLQSNLIGHPNVNMTFFSSGGPASTRPALIEFHDANLDLYRMIEKESRRWDGSGPVRRLGN